MEVAKDTTAIPVPKAARRIFKGFETFVILMTSSNQDGKAMFKGWYVVVCWLHKVGRP